MHDVFITGIRTYHDAEKGAQNGYNTAYLIEIEGMKLCHLGDLGHPLNEDQLEVLNGCRYPDDSGRRWGHHLH